jgi:hypothetical protein
LAGCAVLVFPSLKAQDSRFHGAPESASRSTNP